MTVLYVDADACPVKDEVVRVAERHGLRVFMVGNQWMRHGHHPLVESVVVPADPDAADHWIAERAGPGDVVITSDVPLAARCIAARAKVLAPSGKPFTEAGIGDALATRDLMKHLRDSGEITGGPGAFTKQSRSRFLSELETMIQAARRGR